MGIELSDVLVRNLTVPRMSCCFLLFARRLSPNEASFSLCDKQVIPKTVKVNCNSAYDFYLSLGDHDLINEFVDFSFVNFVF